jgi:hypothetical protein
MTAARLVRELVLTVRDTVLEPSAGDGSFLIPLVERFMELHEGSTRERLERALTENVFAIELDPALHARCLEHVRQRFGSLPARHNIVCADFFRHTFVSASARDSLFGGPRLFDWIVGNPPFGGTIDPAIQDQLDRLYGERDGIKIKKETYCFFIVKSVDLLAPGGHIRFICSDTFLTIPTMKGLREFLLNRGAVQVARLVDFSDETNQPTVVLDFTRGAPADHVQLDGRVVDRAAIKLTGNRSWQITEDHAPFFEGPTLAEYVTASSGMTIGQNDLFVRKIEDGCVTEPHEFVFFDDPITLEKELQHARLGYLAPRRIAEIEACERRGATRRNVRAVPLPTSTRVALPHSDYCPYNKACADLVYALPRYAVFWRDDGDAVITFKKNGNWYLHGVGGLPYFKREGLTWQLISPSLNTRYLPPGYILDSGAPCAFLKPHVSRDELWFILGWTFSALCNRLLKDVLNHTRNIQSKDFERLPYPFWVDPETKNRAIARVRQLVEQAMAGRRVCRTDAVFQSIGRMYEAIVQHGRMVPADGRPSDFGACTDIDRAARSDQPVSPLPQSAVG